MTKNFTKPLVAGLAVLLCSGTAQAVDIAVNGGFETGDFTGWTLFGVSSSQTIVSPGQAGSFAAQLALTGGPSDSLIKNANIGIGIVQPNQMVTIEFDAKGTNAAGGVLFAEFFSELSGGGTSNSILLGGAPLYAIAQGAGFNANTWTHFVFNVMSGNDVSGGVTVQLKSSCGADANCVSDNSWDNLTVSVVPVPAAVWLFGSAVGLIGFMRRRAAA